MAGGLSCSFCVLSLTKALSRMEGVREANGNLAHQEALIVYQLQQVTPAQLKSTLQALGYSVRDPKKVRTCDEEDAEIRRERSRLILAAGLTLVAFAMMVVMWLRVLPMGRLKPWLALASSAMSHRSSPPEISSASRCSSPPTTCSRATSP